MKQLTNFVTSLSRHLDKIAGLCVIGTMLLVVANILLRTLFSKPILGSYEIVSYLTALAIGFALAHCAVQSGHIAVGIIVDRLSKSLQAVIDSAINLTALVLEPLRLASGQVCPDYSEKRPGLPYRPDP